jgi:hypothetical protein
VRRSRWRAATDWVRILAVRVLTRMPMVSITAKVNRYCESWTTKVYRGSVKKKLKSSTAAKEAAMAGPRPNQAATEVTASRKARTRFASLSPSRWKPKASPVAAARAPAVAAYGATGIQRGGAGEPLRS